MPGCDGITVSWGHAPHCTLTRTPHALKYTSPPGGALYCALVSNLRQAHALPSSLYLQCRTHRSTLLPFLHKITQAQWGLAPMSQAVYLLHTTVLLVIHRKKGHFDSSAYCRCIPRMTLLLRRASLCIKPAFPVEDGGPRTVNAACE